MHSYIASGNQMAADLALEFGADINARDDGYQGTPLAWAARLGNKEMVDFLLRKGAQTDLLDEEPWMTPRYSGQKTKDMVKLSNGYRAMLRNHNDSNPTKYRTITLHVAQKPLIPNGIHRILRMVARFRPLPK